jgi:hypothetical protein
MTEKTVTAVRDPKRGKAHRDLSHPQDRRHYVWGQVASCGAPMRLLTERLPLEQTSAGDRCKRCFPPVRTLSA